MRFFIYALSIFILFTACQPEELPGPVDEQPVFFLQGKIAGETINMEAGNDGYYMYTDFDREDPPGIYVFESNMQRTSCLPEIPCPDQLRILFRDIQISDEGSTVDPTVSFPIGEYAFWENETLPPAAYLVSFSAESSTDDVNTYDWSFGDGNNSNEAAPIHEYNSFDEYEVCLEMKNADGEVSKICNDLSLREGACQANFSHEVLPQFGNYVQYRSASTGDLPIKYQWDFGEGVMATLSNPGYFYPNSGVYKTCLAVVDENGCRSRLCKNIAANSNDFAGSFTYDVAELVVPRDENQTQTVGIQWTDPNGNVYRSDRLRQGEGSHFEILSVEPWEKNELGQPTVRLQIRLSCVLKGNGPNRKIEDVTGYIAVAYPSE